ncbi:hypothetical protein [cf. Phormidesmis sp. LEGE 11477]|uniref:hypothetical protein n=1 Tax=cf. Phormidesmis sp. LEGE 11477 TaxID=1828680 RepID=UPI001881BAD2|nr:hypothetical protein [cf. Phormidesmis sp. LEGE 11477]MBE9064807.1 hypothetical protein [cf. Phormidesmis sp. LEGE 11477]
MPPTHTSTPDSRTRAQKHTQPSARKVISQSAKHEKKNSAAKVSLNRSARKRKALLASGAAATLMVAIVLPDRVSSEAIAQSNCQQVIQSGAEMSRDEISALLSVPVGATKQSVRQAVLEPYCTLPLETPTEEKSGDTASSKITEREAYPLAFDPSVWIVLNYESETYAGYDFVFRQ